ncbi:MAG: hypothetical protein II827_02680 [Paludibacteraceae bacterium]|nr:hypothetical protein [Paludibacteraceae bacterium]
MKNVVNRALAAKKQKLFLLAALVMAFAACNDNEPSNNNGGNGGGNVTITNQYVAKPFTVGAGKTVVFSQGNLQYNPAQNIWRFATLQYDTIGSANQNVAPDYDGWLDVFGWGTGKNPTMTSTSDADYSVFEDWGQNPISNGANTPDEWRTMTTAEWLYLFNSRDNHENRFGFGSVAGIGGIILLPDEWTLPEGLTFYTWKDKGFIYDGRNYKLNESTVETNGFAHNVYTAVQWMDMEKAGALFLPAAGTRKGTIHGGVNELGYYYHADKYGSSDNSATRVRFHVGGISPDAGIRFWTHGSVRLAKDVN